MMLSTVIKMTGRIQPGLRAISSNVGFGEKSTPMTLPKGEIAAWGSAAGTDAGIGAVAIEDSFTTGTTGLQGPASRDTTLELGRKYHTWPGRGISGTAAMSSRV